jgi:uncharacterized protein
VPATKNPFLKVTPVTNPRKPLRLNVGFIVNAQVGYNRDFDFFIPKFQDEAVLFTDVEGTAKVGRTHEGLLIQGKFHGKTTLECVRCLTDFEQALQWEFTELYAFTEENMTDSELLVPDDGQIDLEDLVREFAILEIPIKPLCREDCQGLCQECGQNLNEKDCGHEPEIDSPFSTLRNFLDEQTDEEEK